PDPAPPGGVRGDGWADAADPRPGPAHLHPGRVGSRRQRAGFATLPRRQQARQARRPLRRTAAPTTRRRQVRFDPRGRLRAAAGQHRQSTHGCRACSITLPHACCWPPVPCCFTQAATPMPRHGTAPPLVGAQAWLVGSSSFLILRYRIGAPVHWPARCRSKLATVATAPAPSMTAGPCCQAGVEPLANQPLNVTGVVAMLALHARAGLLRPEMRYTAAGHSTRIGTMSIDLHGDPPAGLPAGVQPHWALVSDDQAIAYPIAMAVG